MDTLVEAAIKEDSRFEPLCSRSQKVFGNSRVDDIIDGPPMITTLQQILLQ